MKSSPSLSAHTEKRITRTCVCFSFLCKIVCNSDDDDDAAFIPFKRHTSCFFSIHEHQPRRNAIFPAVCHIFSPNKLEIYYIVYVCRISLLCFSLVNRPMHKWDLVFLFCGEIWYTVARLLMMWYYWRSLRKSHAILFTVVSFILEKYLG